MITQIKEIKFYRHIPGDIKSFVRILSVFYPRKIWESSFSNRIQYGNIDIVQRRYSWYIDGDQIAPSDVLTTEMFKEVKERL
jgi:hypothetical protein